MTRLFVDKVEAASRDEVGYDHSTNTETVTKSISDEIKLFSKDLVISALRDCSKIDGEKSGVVGMGLYGQY